MAANPLFRECDELGVSYWHCPSFLFVFSGVVTIVLVTITYIIMSVYYSAEIVLLSISLVTLGLLVLIFFVYRGMIRIVDTERTIKETNEKLKQAIERLHEAEKIKDEYTNMMIHDLRSPLNGVRMVSEMLLGTKAVADSTKKQSLKLIHTNVGTMLELINDLLDVSKLEAGRFQLDPVRGDLQETVEGVVQGFEALADHKGIVLNYITDEAVPDCRYDRKAVNQVVSNLLSNALKFTDPEGRITIRTFFQQRGEPDAAVLKDVPNTVRSELAQVLRSTDQHIGILVCDTGVGIRSSELSKLFQKYEQTTSGRKSTTKGTGLGLVIVKGIMEAHRGSVRAFSQEGEGSCFLCLFPVH